MGSFPFEAGEVFPSTDSPRSLIVRFGERGRGEEGLPGPFEYGPLVDEFGIRGSPVVTVPRLVEEGLTDEAGETVPTGPEARDGGGEGPEAESLPRWCRHLLRIAGMVGAVGGEGGRPWPIVLT